MPNSITQPVFDLHAHPSLKVYLFKKKLYKNYPAGGAWNPLTLRVNLPKMKDGGVQTLVCSHYVLEKEMIDDCWLIKSGLSAGGLFIGRWKKILKKKPYKVTKKMINVFNEAVEKAQQKGWQVTIAHTKTELEAALAADKIIFLHAVEGAHTLGGKIKNLEKLFNKGVCMLTPAHVYENEATQCVGGIPPDFKSTGCFQNEGVQGGGLYPFGVEVINKMIDIGMIIDMTHCTPAARTEIFNLNNNQRPLIMSHVGVHAMNSHPMNPTDTEIKQIAACGGVVGIILYTYWLKSPNPPKNGLDLISNTAAHIKNMANIAGIDHVAIGSDFDGFTDPPDDINDSAMFPDLQSELKNSGFTDAEIEKIFKTNALRVLRDGWG
jgi:membrane dipeptidase